MKANELRKLSTEELAAKEKELSKELGDVLLHVIDASSPQVHSQIVAVEAILKQLGHAEKPMIRILNKTDLIEPEQAIELARQYDGIAISAKFRSSTMPLIERIQDFYLEQSGQKPRMEAQIKVRSYDDETDVIPFEP